MCIASCETPRGDDETSVFTLSCGHATNDLHELCAECSKHFVAAERRNGCVFLQDAKVGKVIFLLLADLVPRADAGLRMTCRAARGSLSLYRSLNAHLSPIGEAPYNEYVLRPVKPAWNEFIPALGFGGTLGKSSNVGLLRRALAQRLLFLGHEGRCLQDDKTS